MSDTDAEDLIARLSGGLAPADRAAFRKAAETALATEPQCWGEGSAYRTVARLWRSYFHPPLDTGGTSWDEHRQRPSKLLTEDLAPHNSRARQRNHGLRVPAPNDKESRTRCAAHSGIDQRHSVETRPSE